MVLDGIQISAYESSRPSVLFLSFSLSVMRCDGIAQDGRTIVAPNVDNGTRKSPTAVGCDQWLPQPCDSTDLVARPRTEDASALFTQ